MIEFMGSLEDMQFILENYVHQTVLKVCMVKKSLSICPVPAVVYPVEAAVYLVEAAVYLVEAAVYLVEAAVYLVEAAVYLVDVGAGNTVLG